MTGPAPMAERREKKPDAVPEHFTQHWRAYYVNGTALTSRDCPWEQLPSGEIIAVVHAIDDEPAACELGTPYYWNMGDWICRVWDPTLYLRKAGVKFGRWAPHNLFNDAWRQALRIIAKDDDKYRELVTGDALTSGCVFTTDLIRDREAGTAFALFYDDQTAYTNTSGPFLQAPADGVLCAVYSVVYSGMKVNCAMRRYTYYYWREHELRNTDDLQEVLKHFPACKAGTPHFTGPSYRHQAEAIAKALQDNLEGVR